MIAAGERETEGTAPALRRSVLRGLGWLAGAQAARQALQIVFRVLLARLLVPEEFGLLAMVTVVSGSFLILSDLGFGPALVRKERVTHQELSTVFWITAAAGLVLALATAGLGPLLARFYRQPPLIGLCAGLAPGSLLTPLAAVPTAILQRRLAYGHLAVIDVLSISASGVIALGLAASGYGVWALVWQMNCQPLVILLLSLAGAEWLPGRHFDPALPARLWHFGSHLTAGAVLNYWVRNLDNLLVGAFLGRAALGYYSQAYQMMLYPVQNVAALAGRAMFPALATIQPEAERFRRGYVEAIEGIAAFTFPLMLGALVLAPELFAVLFGPRWAPAVLLFRLLCLVGMVQSLVTTVGWIYLATGRTDLQLRWTLIAAGVVFPAFLLGLRWGGLLGLTVGYALASGILCVPALIVAYRQIDLPLSMVAHRLAPLLFAAAGMAAAVLALRWMLAPYTGPAARLLTGIGSGAVTYWALLQLLGAAPAARVRHLWLALRSPV